MLCLTFDTDHMDEVRMGEFLERVEIPGAATFFCTQEYRSISATHHEVAPHPTLEEGKNWRAELRRMREMFPQARGWRSHSCVFSHLIAEWLSANGYAYASTNDQFGHTRVQPVRQPWGLWQLPIFYMDNMDFSSACFWADDLGGPFSDTMIEKALVADGLYIFDFHPIHLLLNTPDRDRYFAVRDRFKAGAPIGDLAYVGPGTKSFYDKLCISMAHRGQKSVNLAKALEAHIAKEAETSGCDDHRPDVQT